MQKKTNKRVQTITQNIDKVKGCKTKKRVCQNSFFENMNL